MYVYVCESVSRSVVCDSRQPRGLWLARLLCPWDDPGQNTGVGSLSLLQGIFPTQGLNPSLPHCRQTLLSESLGKPQQRPSEAPPPSKKKSSMISVQSSYVICCSTNIVTIYFNTSENKWPSWTYWKLTYLYVDIHLKDLRDFFYFWGGCSGLHIFLFTYMRYWAHGIISAPASDVPSYIWALSHVYKTEPACLHRGWNDNIFF